MENQKRKVLVVDDELVNVKLFDMILRAEGYDVCTALSGEEALSKVYEYMPDVIILDIMMPGIDGFEVADVLKKNESTRSIPIIMITALQDRDSKVKGLSIGAEEFINKPIDRTELLIRVRNLTRIKAYNNLLANYNQQLQDTVRKKTDQLRFSYLETILALSRASEFKDKDTGSHVRRISYYCLALSEKLGLSKEFRDYIFYASPMHDIGKIGIPDEILSKPGPLSKQEWKILKTHTTLGKQILQDIESPYLKMGADIACYHHETWSGTGYPIGLKGEEIPLSARIVNICDQYDALMSKRPYKPAFEHEKTVSILIHGDGRTMPEHFDPEILNTFSHITNTFYEIYIAHKNDNFGVAIL